MRIEEEEKDREEGKRGHCESGEERINRKELSLRASQCVQFLLYQLVGQEAVVNGQMNGKEESVRERE